MFKIIGWILIGLFFVFYIIGKLVERFYVRIGNVCAYIAIIAFIIGMFFVFILENPCPRIIDDQYIPISYP